MAAMTCRPCPPPKCRRAPRARLWKPAATAARCSASSLARLREEPRTRPSRERITALSICATRLTRSSRSQSSSPEVMPAPSPNCCAAFIVSLRSLLAWRPAGGPGRLGRRSGLVLAAGGRGLLERAAAPVGRVEHGPALLPALLDRGHRGPDLVRRPALAGLGFHVRSRADRGGQRVVPQL